MIFKISYKKIIPFSLIFNLTLAHININVNVNASDYNRYENIEGSSILIKDILEDSNVDIEIEGNTLVNLVKGRHKKELKNGSSNTRDIEINVKKDMLSSQKTYSFIVKGTHVNYYGANILIEYKDGSQSKIFNGIIKDNHSNLFTVENKEIESINWYSWLANEDDAKYLLEDIIIIEGDYLNKEINYFEGLISVGENTNSINSITLNSSSTNHFNINGEINSKYNNMNAQFQNELTEDGGLKANNYTYSHHGVGQIIKLKKFTDYTFSARLVNNGCIGFHTKNTPNYRIKYFYEGNAIWTFNTGNESEFIISFNTSGNESSEKAIFYDIMLSESSHSNGYEKYNYNELNIKLNEPLRGLPNGTKDRIIKKNGQWVVERNCYQLDFSKHPDIRVSYGGESSDNYITAYIPWKNLELIGLPLGFSNEKHSDVSNSIINNKLSVISKSSMSISSGIGADINGFNISIPRKLLNTNINDADLVKEWAIQNDIKIIYQLTEPIYEPLNINLSLPIYEGTTYISNDSIIPATMKVKIDRIANKSSEAVEEAISTPTLHNISLARMWVNQMPESLLKDEMQMRLSNISNMQDIKLDKKNITSNLDLYIKSENMLSLSLNTNSITFEDFSGVEDLELNNVVNLTINSSLPYELNAYLATEIQNSDKSNTMDKSILNIKESGESNYKAFNNINEKLTLKDNNIAGNDIIHNLDLLLRGGISHEKDVYKTTIKFEAKQK